MSHEIALTAEDFRKFSGGMRDDLIRRYGRLLTAQDLDDIEFLGLRVAEHIVRCVPKNEAGSFNSIVPNLAIQYAGEVVRRSLEGFMSHKERLKVREN